MLRLDAHIGHFAPGAEADFIILDPEATPLLARRMRLARTLSEQLQIYMILGDDRAVADTYILGRPCNDAAANHKPRRDDHTLQIRPRGLFARLQTLPCMLRTSCQRGSLEGFRVSAADRPSWIDRRPPKLRASIQWFVAR